MQGLPHVASMDSLLIPRSGDSTGGDARPACLRPGSTAALRRGDLFLQPLSQPSLHVPPPLCRAHGHPPGQGDSPHMPSQKSFKTCSVAKAIVPRCPSSPPWKEKGSISAGLVFLPYCDSGQFVTPPPQTTTSSLRASQSIMGRAGPSRPNRAQNHTTGVVPVEREAFQVPSWLLSGQLAQRRTTAPDSCLWERKWCGWQPRRGDRTQGQPQHETRECGCSGHTWPRCTQPRRCGAGEQCPGSDPGANAPPPRGNGKQQQVGLCLLLPSSRSGILSKSPCTSAPQSPGV